MKNAEIIATNTHHSSVNIGSTVKVKIKDDERTYTIVGSNEANPKEGKISNESLVGKNLLGKEVGKKIKITTPSGENEYEIISIN